MLSDTMLLMSLDDLSSSLAIWVKEAWVTCLPGRVEQSRAWRRPLDLYSKAKCFLVVA